MHPPVNKRHSNSSNSGGLISELYNITVKYPALNFLLTLTTGAASGAVVSYKYIEEKVNAAADKRLLPYMSLFSALNLNQAEDYKESIKELQELIATKQIDVLSQNSKTLTYDALLHAIANTDDIGNRKFLLNETTSWLNKYAEKTGWRQHEAGWAWMRVGDLERATENFEEAVISFRAERDYTGSGDSFRGLLVIALIKNDPNKAFAIGQDLKELLPSVYRDNLDLISDIREARKRKYFDIINAIHEDTLKISVPRYISMLERQTPKQKR